VENSNGFGTDGTKEKTDRRNGRESPKNESGGPRHNKRKSEGKENRRGMEGTGE